MRRSRERGFDRCCPGPRRAGVGIGGFAGYGRVSAVLSTAKPPNRSNWYASFVLFLNADADCIDRLLPELVLSRLNVSKRAPTAAVTVVEPGVPVRPPRSVNPGAGLKA